MPLYRAFNPSNGDHFYTAHEAEYANAVNNGYLAEGTAGFLLPAPAAGTIPFFRLLQPSTGSHFYTTSVTERDNAIANHGYLDEGIVGYVWASATMGAAPFYRSFNPSSGDHFYTMDAGEHANATATLGYTDEGIACYLQPASATNRIPFFRCLNPENGNHFYTTDQAERDNAINNLGYLGEGIACYVHSDNTGGASPFHRLYHPGTGAHFYTTDAGEHANATANLGYKDEGIACFIFVRPVAGTIPLFRLFKAYDAYVDVNLIAVAGDSWTSAQSTMFVNGFAGAAQIFKQVRLRLRQGGQFFIPTALAGGYPTIDNDSEAEDLTDDWTVPNSAIDLFGVPVMAGTLGGLSPNDGPCDKDAQGMDGVVAEIMAPLNVIIAHELGHYMGLDHDESPLNLMNAAGSAANTAVTSEQGSTIKEHCFVAQY